MLINSKSILAFFYPNIATQPIFTNIVKGEGRKPNLFEFYAKPQPIFYKYSERLIFDRRTEEQNFSRLSILKSVLVFFCQNIMKHVSDIFIPSRTILSKFKQKRAETRNGFVFSALSAYKKLVLCSKANLFIFQIFYRRRMSGTPALISDRTHRYHQKENKRQGKHPPAHLCFIGEILQPTAYYPIRYRH